MQTKFLALALAVLVMAACATTPPRPPPVPPAPAVQCLAMVVSPAGVYTVTINGVSGPTEASGYAYRLLPAGSYVVTVAADGFVTTTARYTAQPTSGCDTPITMVRARRQTGEAGPLTIRDAYFVTQDGRPWVGRGISDFLLFAKFLAGQPLDAVLNERVDLGRTYVRVFGTLGSWGNPASALGDGIIHLFPQEHADYYAQLGPFADYLALFGMRVEFVIFADGQIVMPNYQDRQAHADRVVAALAGHWNVVGIEVANEPFKNLPGGDAEAAEQARRLKGRGVPIAAGDVSQLPWALASAAVGDYGTHHADRKPEWPRTGKDIMELMGTAHIPFWSDEPMGASDDQGRINGGSRSNTASDFRQFGANTSLFGTSLFHCDNCAFSQLLNGTERAMAEEFNFGQQWAPREAQTYGYMRGDNCGDCNGIGGMPLMQWDMPHPQGSVRTFCKSDGTNAWCVAVQPAPGWTAQARGGWHLVDEPRRGLVKLAR
jgi:hypothetical protein